MPDLRPDHAPAADPPLDRPRARLAWTLIALTGALLSLAASPRPARAQWTDITTPLLADTTWIRDKKGVAMIDFDGDGDLDIAVVGEGLHAGSFFRNDGNGVFTDVTPAPLLAPGSGSSQTWGDFDNDGDLDVFVGLEEEPMRLLRNDGNGVFTNITAGVLADVAHGHSSTWVDYDRDGLLDLYVAFFHQPSRLLHNAGGVLVDATTDSLGAFPGDGIAWGDYDNDGDPDVYLARFSNYPNLLLRNDGAAGFRDITPLALEGNDNSHSAACADYDNDGDLDIYVANSFAPNHLFRNDLPGGFTDVTPANMALGAHSVGECWGDFDNDGWLDLYVTETDNGVNHMFHNNGDGTFTEVTAGPLAGTGTNAGIAAGDIDGDGDLDLYVSSYLSRPNLLLRNDLANGNHWLELDLQGTVSNRSAIGARVWLTAGGMTQMREVSGNMGFRSQCPLTVHFGLGSATQVDRLRIRWPSGIWQDTTLDVVDRRLKIVERGTNLAAPEALVTTAAVALAAPAPNPVAGSTELGYSLAAPATGRLAILDTQGRSVRVLAQGALAMGTHRVTWDGRDAGGALVPGGIYWCVLEAAGQRRARRLAVLR